MRRTWYGFGPIESENVAWGEYGIPMKRREAPILRLPGPLATEVWIVEKGNEKSKD
jgi:hypothetical protein